jgi:hypothetical protein
LLMIGEFGHARLARLVLADALGANDYDAFSRMPPPFASSSVLLSIVMTW